MTIEVRAVAHDDAEAWMTLYNGYRDFYWLPEDPEAVARTWDWIVNREHKLLGLVATDDAALIGFANLRWFARPSTATIGLYLDDLFVSSSARSRGVGRALLARTREVAGEGGASVVRWITAADNATARRLYDDVAQSTPWVTYDMPPAS